MTSWKAMYIQMVNIRKPKIYPQYFLSDASEPVEDLLCAELTQEEIKAAFRLFDDTGEGFITTTRFRVSIHN